MREGTTLLAMKALVLAGGSGTRLRPITHTSAKQLLPVANTPVLFYGLRAIADGGITQLTEKFRAKRPDAQIMLTRVTDPRAFGVAELDDSGKVVGLEEKPQQPKSDLALVGVYMFTP